ncbi:RloB family protein [Cronobacter dublinensis]|uniref:RloB family protein n=1 Tax=Cronobacter dublinensis TaxID=413497 RepID=UPI0024AEA1D4|nr:RloB family protein [Cronobacter dublinensis]MDI7398442.1 RloB family protein [Cronobacter dublinensis]
MGSENLFKKRVARRNQDFKRVSKARAPMKKILIVCEGEKTEPVYFKEFVNFCRISTASIVEITGECGSSPTSVVTWAKDRYNMEKKRSDPYDKVYCVFDRDAHPNYLAAVSQIQSLKPENVFEAITSIPCFEYWLLLHFGYSRKSFSPQKGKSEGAQMLSELKKHMPHYEKKATGVFTELYARLNDALQHSQRVQQAAAKDGSDNPTTKIGIMVEQLIQIRDEFEKKGA